MLIAQALRDAPRLYPLSYFCSDNPRCGAVCGRGTVCRRFSIFAIGGNKCRKLAKAKGLAPGRYACYGALYSALLLVPYCYLLRRLNGHAFPRWTIVYSYRILFIVFWGYGVIFFLAVHGVFYSLLANAGEGPFLSEIEQDSNFRKGISLLAIMAANIIVFVVSVLTFDGLNRHVKLKYSWAVGLGPFKPGQIVRH